MGRLAVLVAAVSVAACAKHHDAPPSPLQDGAAVAIAIDAPPIAADAPAPREPPTATKVVVAAHAACALLSDATVRCWGGNTEGQLGDGSTRGSTVPVMPNVRGVKDLVLGDDFACALIDDTSVVCWGKIGFGKDHRLLVPTAAPGVREIVRIFAVGGAACGTAKTGALVCWGDVDPRGHVTTTGNAHAPTPVPGLDHVLLLTAHAAVNEAHVLSSWTDGGTPVATTFTNIAELAEHDVPCVLREGGEVACVADHALCGAPIALTATPAAPPPAPVKKPKKGKKPKKSKAPPPVVGKIAAYALPEKASHLAFDTGVCVVTQKRFDCFDLAHACKVTRQWPAFVNVDDSAGACARLANGTVRCGALGVPAAPLIAGVANAITVSATATRGCALTKQHQVLCWEGTAPATVVAFGP
ncbi:MAG TPA: RCC1 domain-containing protein [Kofleriaceae bacterium]|nr:RCC1 domain-containing protein [Kofleriaceae bacterium]